jgi:protease-4
MKPYRWLLIVAALLTAGCSLPKMTLFGESREPLQEFVLQGSGPGKILLLSIDGTISDRPQERILRTQPSMVQQAVAYLKHAEQDPEIKVLDRKSTRLNSSHNSESRMPSSA